MTQAIVDPAELRRFAQTLRRFNEELNDRTAAMNGQLNTLSQSWRDQEHLKFAEEFHGNLLALSRFVESNEAYIPYLLRKAQLIEEYLQQRYLRLSRPIRNRRRGILMSESANVRSLDAVRRFASSVVHFQEEARHCLTQLEMELRKVIGWIERERPGFWKREIELCRRRQSEARVMLHKCQMRRVGDFRPTCFEERKYVQRCKDELEFAQRQIEVIKRWSIVANQEAEEYFGRSVQLVQAIERDLPRLMALLRHAIDRLDEYKDVQVPGSTVGRMAHAATELPQSDCSSPVVLPVDETDKADPDSVSQETPS